MFLQGAGFAARQQVAGGNVDIYVDDIGLGFKLVGEAKRYASTTSIEEGYKQLTTRYAYGSDEKGHAHGALIGYLRRPKAKQLIAEWQNSVWQLPESPDMTFQKCLRMAPYAFYTEHTHQDSGYPFHTWHICVQLNVDPQDKSGITSKAGIKRATDKIKHESN